MSPAGAQADLIDLAVAFGIGLLIGLERGWSYRDDAERGPIAGWRTFGIVGLMGGVFSILGAAQGPIILAAGVAAVTVFFALGYYRMQEHERGHGITTEIAALVTFGLGALAGRGEIAVSASAAILMALVLGFKPEMNSLLQRIERRELLATLRLLLISVVFLSLLPDQGYGPWAAINPYAIWRMVVIIAAIGYVGHFAIRIIGPSAGMIATALLGGLASSTATTAGLARRGARLPEEASPLAAGVALASAVMMVRMGVVSWLIAPGLALPLAAALVPAALTAAAVALLMLLRRPAGASAGDATGDPLDIGGAMVMGAIFAAAAFLVQAVQHHAGAAGLYPLAFLSGFFDVDAVTLSLASGVSGGTVDAGVAVGAILLAGLVNTLMKPALVLSIAGPRMAAATALPLLLAAAAGAAGWILVP